MKTQLNLLPAQFRRQLIVRSGLWLWSAVLLLVCAALVALGYREHAKLSAVRSRAEDVEARGLPLKATQQENDDIGRRIADLHGRQTLLAQLDRGRHPLQLLGLVSRSARFVEGELKVAVLAYQISEPPAPAATADNPQQPPPPPAPETIRMTLDGIAANDLAVSKFIVALRDSGYFASVELKSSVSTKQATGPTRKFLVECTL